MSSISIFEHVPVLLKIIQKRVGEPCIGVIIAAFVVAMFATAISPAEPVSQLVGVMWLLAIVLFGVGILLGVLHELQQHISFNPHLGLFHGIIAGLGASVLGGAHFASRYLEKDEIKKIAEEWALLRVKAVSEFPCPDDGFFMRLLAAVALGVPAFALWGIGLAILRSDKKINWRNDFTTILLALIFIIGGTAFGVNRFMPTFPDRAFTVGDLMLMQCFFIVGYFGLSSLELHWNMGQFLRGFFFLGFFQGALFCFAGFVSAHGDNNYHGSLYGWPFIKDADSDYGSIVAIVVIATLHSIAFGLVIRNPDRFSNFFKRRRQNNEERAKISKTKKSKLGKSKSGKSRSGKPKSGKSKSGKSKSGKSKFV